MYKSRLHTWGLDKKKKEHEMLDLVRQGLSQKGEDKEKVFIIRGRSVTLADALHYFNRKGIKDPTTLLDQSLDGIGDFSSPDDADVKTPLSTEPDILDSLARGDSDYDMGASPPPRPIKSITSVPLQFKAAEFADRRLASLQAALGIHELKPMPAFRTLSRRSRRSTRAEQSRGQSISGGHLRPVASTLPLHLHIKESVGQQYSMDRHLR